MDTGLITRQCPVETQGILIRNVTAGMIIVDHAGESSDHFDDKSDRGFLSKLQC
jgi:hypothetical protein